MYNTTLSVAQVMNAAIRDTNPTNATAYLLDQMNKKALLVINGTDQAVVISAQHSTDGVTFRTVGTTANVAAGATLVSNEINQDVTAIKLFSGYLRLVATAAVAPLSGNVEITIQGMNQ